MLWNKTKYKTIVRYGKAEIKTDGMHGLIQHLAIVPKSKTTMWSADIRDGQDDIVYQVIDHEGRLDEYRGIPVGRDKPECLTVNIYDSTANGNIEVMFKVREIR